MGRELRKVPANWEHPKKDNGYYQPMYETYYGDVLAKWLAENAQWEAGTHPDIVQKPELKIDYPFFAMWGGNAPDPEYYHTRKYAPEELTHIQLYETTSEGTPTSPVFPADQLEQLCEYAAEHCSTFARFKATKEEWMQMLGDGFVSHSEGNIKFI